MDNQKFSLTKDYELSYNYQKYKCAVWLFLFLLGILHVSPSHGVLSSGAQRTDAEF